MKASLYFRWDRHADWYFVPMTPGPGGAWQGILPKTAAGTTGAVYYVESLNNSYVATRGSMHRVPVTPGNACQQQDPKVKTFEGDPQTTVGATSLTASLSPPGFDVEGIGQYISADGTTTETDGGRRKTPIILAAVGAGVVGGFVAANSGVENAPPPSPPVAGTPAPPSPPVAGTPPPPPPPPGTPPPPPGTPPPPPPTPPPTPPPADHADVSLSLSAPSSTSVGGLPIIEIGATNNGPGQATSIGINVSWPSNLLVGQSGFNCSASGGCGVGTLNDEDTFTGRIEVRALAAGTATITAVITWTNPDGSRESSNKTITIMISANLRAGNEAVKTRFRTDLLVKPRDGSVHAQAVMNGSLLHTDNAGERTLHFEARVGVNAFEGSVKQAGRRTGFWKFDFSGTPHFVVGSLRAQSGRTVSQDGKSIIFAVEPNQQPIRFTFEVNP